MPETTQETTLIVCCPYCGGDGIYRTDRETTATQIDRWVLDDAGRPEVDEWGKAVLLDADAGDYGCDACGMVLDLDEMLVVTTEGERVQ